MISIEAHPKTYSWLTRLYRANALDNVRLHQFAIMGSPGELFITDDSHDLGNTVVVAGKGDIRVPAETLDNIVRTERLTHVDYLKMNIEGGELPALDGMDLTLGMTRHVCISCHDDMADAGAGEEMRTKAGVRRLLEAKGFTVTSRPDDPRPWVRDYLYGTGLVH